MKRRSFVYITLLCIGIGEAIAQNRSPRSDIRLEGESSGGVMCLIQAPTVGRPLFCITNSAGDTASTVVTRISENFRTNCPPYYKGTLISATNGTFTLGGGVLDEGCSGWALAGSESGFNIPEPPLELSAAVSQETVRIQWQNPPSGYDRIAIIYWGMPLLSLPGTATNYIHQLKFGPPGNPGTNGVPIFIIGEKNGTPSNGTGILAAKDRQEALMSLPFSAGLAQGFRKWTIDTPMNAFEWRQGELSDAELDWKAKREGKRFYQAMRASGNFTGGVSRRFVGLSPGHSYRISARLNTLNTSTGDWTYSLHAVHHLAGDNGLTAAQMAGRVALPNGTKGKTAGLIAKYDRHQMTEGEWILHSSGETDSKVLVSDITLPEGVSSLTIWLRLEGKGTEANVGFDSVTLEDVVKQ